MAKERLVTPSYCFMLLANFLLAFSFWLLIPIFPFFLSDNFHTGEAIIGLVISCYMISCLCIRPFSGYLIDTFARKPLYILAYFIFTCIFAGYLIASTITLFIIFRLVHGASFGMVSVGGNTIIIDIMPSSRRGEGLGYFGLTNNFAMALGPMVGLFLHQNKVCYNSIFLVSLCACTIGFLFGSIVRTPYKPPIKRAPLSCDRFLLIKGLPAGFSLMLLSIPYGMTTNYIALYAQRIGIKAQTGLFFTCMAIGMAVARIFSGKLVDKGKISQLISLSLNLIIVTFFLLSFCNIIFQANTLIGTIMFFFTALFIGIGFGVLFPAYNTLFVNLAPNSQRGTATSTYLTSWDIGISIGMITGGIIAQLSSFGTAYFLGAILSIISTLYFNFKVIPHYNKNKLR